MEAHHGAKEAQHSALEAYYSAMEAHHGAMEAQHGAMEAQHGVLEAYYGGSPWRRGLTMVAISFTVADSAITTNSIDSSAATMDLPRRLKMTK